MFNTGVVSGGPGGDIEQAMHAADLDHPGLFNDSYPQSQLADGLPALVEVHYRITKPWSVGVLYGRSLNGYTVGNGPSFGQFIRVNYKVTSVAAMLSAGPRSLRPLQFALGPALYLAESNPGTPGGGQPAEWSEQWKVGFIAQARAAVPSNSRVFLDLTVKYSYVGSVVVGPYSATDLGGQVATFPATSVQFNHWLIGLGPGVRF